MSLPTVLKTTGLVFVGLLLLSAFVAMGPLGWAVVGLMFVVGAVQVHRNRRSSTDSPPSYCPNCGAAIAADAYDDEEWDVEYCQNCGAPIGPDADSDGETGVRNCPDCGAPNDPGADECEYCDAGL